MGRGTSEVDLLLSFSLDVMPGKNKSHQSKIITIIPIIITINAFISHKIKTIYLKDLRDIELSW